MSKWNIEDLVGYKPKTSFWDDFSAADEIGIDAIKETYNKSFVAGKDNYIHLTELVMVLNHKLWQHFKTNRALADVYEELWGQTDEYAIENLEGEEVSYFFRTIA